MRTPSLSETYFLGQQQEGYEAGLFCVFLYVFFIIKIYSLKKYQDGHIIL